MILQNNNFNSSENSYQTELIFHLTQVFKLFNAELVEKITSSVISEIEKKAEFKSTENSEKLLNTSELSNLLGVSKSTIIKLREQNLPIIKFGDNIRFDKKDVLEFIQKYKVKGGGDMN